MPCFLYVSHPLETAQLRGGVPGPDLVPWLYVGLGHQLQLVVLVLLSVSVAYTIVVSVGVSEVHCPSWS